MPTYQTILSRKFTVMLDAENEQEATRLVECFVGFDDSSSESERQEFRFRIRNIELVENDVIAVSHIENTTA